MRAPLAGDPPSHTAPEKTAAVRVHSYVPNFVPNPQEARRFNVFWGENVQDRTFLLQRPVTECTADRCGLPFAEAPRRAPSEEPFDVAGAHTIDREIERAREERAHLRQCDLVAPLRVRRELRKLVSFILIEKRGHGDEAGESVLLALGLFHQLRILRPGELFCDPLVARPQRELV